MNSGCSNVLLILLAVISIFRITHTHFYISHIDSKGKMAWQLAGVRVTTHSIATILYSYIMSIYEYIR